MKEEGSLMRRTLVVIRHLKTQDSLDHRFCSGDRDISILPGQILNPETSEQIRQLTKQHYLLAHTSLKRSKETTHLLTQLLAYSEEILILPEFKERLGGQLAGLRFEEIQQFFPELKNPYDLWRIEAPWLGLESAKDFLSRIEIGLKRIHEENKTVVLVTHAGPIKGIRAVLRATTLLERKQILCAPMPHHGECFVFNLKEVF